MPDMTINIWRRNIKSWREVPKKEWRKTQFQKKIVTLEMSATMYSNTDERMVP